MPFQLGYVSTASHEMRRDDLIEILRTARARNDANGVTGLLLYQGGHFLQVLEGRETAVRETFGRIQADARHRDIRVMFEHVVTEPEFDDWSMGFQSLDGHEWLEFPDLDGGTKDLRAVIEDYGRAKEFLVLLRRRGLDPAKDLATQA
jgi:hypothetical protein